MSERIVRGLTLVEVEQLVDWAAAEGWNPGLHDAAVFHATDAEGFIGAFVDGEMVAGIAAVAYGTSYGFVGLYISREDMRGRGHGKAVWDAGMAYLAGRTIGLDGVDEQFENYRRKGFAPAYRTIRFGGRFAGHPVDGANLTTVTLDLLPEVMAFDRRIFPEPRDRFLACWLLPPHLACVAVSHDVVTGYGVARQCRSGWKIGGLSAIDDRAAAALVRHLAAAVDGDIFIDVPASRKPFIGFLLDSGLRPGFETTRMYLGNPIPLAPEVFGVTTLELG
ncbi:MULTISPECIES: GNAT family N-acetyltransferase [unclassified Chelatococcus]|uniref:GNAT family N-acetyltransferase n=1 Tax=unclassified Chelatococcus TaxID=2638111 RepID=UPI001BD0310D|nr:MULTISPECIES: GNAT family N-acetyltransferase [unclassified Chelatococcus]CAH1653475.1 N-acetyltransferase domain-containing protein [Hyphomicrobiales bacterium]MBS7742896.1 GNAT family N-acetyltransferase [Chelatococcus sp. HY11]MBX3541986.1 GNAT family N-acetyltransferase [Chelatococcus sp.]MCO5074122.1 GNAT family N-acetyltransferase [Chelatococcus sp.]CAH1694443.1 N-acetyltransferase domain-containing protein [Hyphomicrobiales bacterium]